MKNRLIVTSNSRYNNYLFRVVYINLTLILFSFPTFVIIWNSNINFWLMTPFIIVFVFNALVISRYQIKKIEIVDDCYRIWFSHYFKKEKLKGNFANLNIKIVSQGVWSRMLLVIETNDVIFKQGLYGWEEKEFKQIVNFCNPNTSN